MHSLDCHAEQWQYGHVCAIWSKERSSCLQAVALAHQECGCSVVVTNNVMYLILRLNGEK